jgi:hypothetical protein
MKLSLLLVLSFFITKILSQDPIDFFPAQTGNIWKYWCYSETWGGVTQVVQSTIIFDSSDVDGTIYLTKKNQCLEQSGPPPWYSNLFPTCKYIIVDSNLVYSEHEHFWTNGDSAGFYFKYKLDAGYGETWIVDFDSISVNQYELTMAKVTNVDTGYFYGLPIVSKEILYYHMSDSTDTLTSYKHFTERLVSNVGQTDYWSWEWYWTGFDFSGAIINGQVFGDTTGIITHISLRNDIIDDFYLYQNYPNPFNSVTNIDYHIRKRSHVKICIYNVSGALVTELYNDIRLPGFYHTVWAGKNSNGRSVSSGIYYLSIVTQGRQKIKRMLLLK